MTGAIVDSIEVLADRTAESRCDEGFLRVARLRLRNRYRDGSNSREYNCDVVSRPGSDAVVAVLYRRRGDGAIEVVLRENLRPPIYLRKFKQFEHPDPREYRSLLEVVAGVVEAGDGPGAAGLARRAALEAREEAGFAVAEEDLEPLGGESFASPGTSDEKIYFCFGDVGLAEEHSPTGDGGVMEEAGRVVFEELGEAIAACRRGEIPDMKTELALLRLADALGYIPQLGCFASELPDELRARYRPPGLEVRD